MDVPRHDFTFVQGNTCRFELRLRGFDGTGSEFVFKVRSPRGATFRRSSEDGGIVAAAAIEDGVSATRLSWSLTPEESRQLGQGKVNPFDLERRLLGDQVTLLLGHLILIAGVNDDA